jgi:hypothetical protein
MEEKLLIKGGERRAVVMYFPRWPVPPAIAIAGFGDGMLVVFDVGVGGGGYGR